MGAIGEALGLSIITAMCYSGLEGNIVGKGTESVKGDRLLWAA